MQSLLPAASRGPRTKAATSELGAGQNSIANYMGRIANYTLAAIVMLSPLPFGSTDNGIVAIWLVLGALCLSLSMAKKQSNRHTAIVVGAMLLSIVLCGLVTFQLSDISGPWADKMWASAQYSLEGSAHPRVSVDADLTLEAAGRALLFAIIFITSFNVGSDRRQAERIVKIVAYSGALYAIYAIAAFSLSPAKLLLAEKTAYVGSLTGTFVNRNTAATYFGVSAIAWLAIAGAYIATKLPRGSTSLWEAAAISATSANWRITLYLTCLLLTLTATFMTFSRAGTLFTLLVMILLLLLSGATGAARQFGGWLGVAGLVLTGILIIELLGGGTGSRFAGAALISEDRWHAYAATFRIIGDHFWFGSGLGTFPEIFPSYRPAELGYRGFWNLAHSTPLELAAELGVPAALAIAAAAMFIVVRLALAVRAGGGRGQFVVPAALGTAVLGIAHSTFDFSLQIPGFYISFCAIVGCGLAQALADDR